MRKIPYRKAAITYEEQLDKLMDRGLAVSNRAYALKNLQHISYYRLSAYWFPFRIRGDSGKATDKFEEAASFETAVELYEFDRHFRLIVMDAIERVEVAVRTRLVYHLSHQYGAFGYLDARNFHPKFGHTKWLSSLKYEVDRSKEEFINCYFKKYADPHLPIWMATEVMSLGALSFLYSGMTNDDKRAVASTFHVHFRRLQEWLHTLTYIRNLCAHHSRLWNRELAIKPKGNLREKEWVAPLTPRNDRVFYVLLILRQMLKESENGRHWQERCEILLEPICGIRRWRIAMGIPEAWKDHPLWDVSQVCFPTQELGNEGDNNV